MKSVKNLKSVKTSFQTTIKDWASLVTAFSLVAIVTLGPIVFGFAIFLAVVKLVWYVLFKL
jgi:hypothetical protein